MPDRPQPQTRDDLGKLIDEQMRDPAFAAAYEDIGVRNSLLDQLVAARKQVGLTQFHVAEAMGIKQPTVSEFEAESSDPRLSTLQRYARAIGGKIRITFDAPLSFEPDEPMSVGAAVSVGQPKEHQ